MAHITTPGILGYNRLCWATFSAGASWIIIWLEIDVLLVLQQLWGWTTLSLWRDKREILLIRKGVQKRETQQLNLNLYHCKPLR